MLQISVGRTLFSVFLVLLMLSAPVGAEDKQVGVPPAKVKAKVTSTIDVRQGTQKKEDDWAAEKEKLAAEYRSLKADREYLKKVQERTKIMLHAQEVQVAETLRMIKEADRINKELQTYLESVVTRLEGWIENDVGFLMEERKSRIASVKEVLARSDKTLAEKYRRVMEVLQIEAEYGRSVEIYRQTVQLKGKERLVDVLRVGRLSLFCRTPDGKLAGAFDQANGKWVALPSKYRREINKAADVADRRRTIELIKLPIGRILVP